MDGWIARRRSGRARCWCACSERGSSVARTGNGAVPVCSLSVSGVVCQAPRSCTGALPMNAPITVNCMSRRIPSTSGAWPTYRTPRRYPVAARVQQLGIEGDVDAMWLAVMAAAVAVGSRMTLRDQFLSSRHEGDRDVVFRKLRETPSRSIESRYGRAYWHSWSCFRHVRLQREKRWIVASPVPRERRTTWSMRLDAPEVDLNCLGGIA